MIRKVTNGSESIAKDLAHLRPEEAKLPIYIGDELFYLYPLSYEDGTKLKEYALKFAKEVIADVSVSPVDVIDQVISKVVPDMLKILGIEDISKTTPAQIAHIADTVIKQNFDISEILGEQASKNLKSFGALMGIAGAPEQSLNDSSHQEGSQNSFVKPTDIIPETSQEDGKSGAGEGIIAGNVVQIVKDAKLNTPDSHTQK